MQLTEAMKKSGQWQLVNGEWVLAESAQPPQKKERVNLVEARQEVGSDNRTEERTGSTKKESRECASSTAYQRVGSQPR
jgi:hypothetical protein